MSKIKKELDGSLTCFCLYEKVNIKPEYVFGFVSLMIFKAYDSNVKLPEEMHIRNQKIISSYLEFNKTLKQIGLENNVGPERVRQLVYKSLRRALWLFKKSNLAKFEFTEEYYALKKQYAQWHKEWGHGGEPSVPCTI